MVKIFRNNRFYILVSAVLLSGLIYIWVRSAVADPSLRSIRLEQIFGFLSMGYLYAALLATPLLKLFAAFPGRGAYFHARRAIGVSAFYFAALHVVITFFGQLEGFDGIGFLGRQYVVSLILGLLAFIVLLLMAITSFDVVVEKLTFPRWKLLHRLAYPAGVAILVHIVLVGTHFSQLSTALPRIVVVALLVLLLLEMIRFDRFVRGRWPGLAYLSVAGLALLAVGFGYIVSFTGNSSGGGASLNVHAQHILLAKQAQSGATGGATNLPNTPSFTGDRTKRYTVSFEHGQVEPGQPAQLEFKIYDASNGSTDFNLQPLYTKLAHLVIVDDSLIYFSHIHPLPASEVSDLSVATTFPHAGHYRLYLNFQPSGAIEQQVGFSIIVGDGPDAAATQPVDRILTKSFDGYKVTIGSVSYSASKLTLGEQKLTFNVYHTDGSPLTTLKPYLGAFGHLVMVNETTYDYIHVHPYSTQLLSQDASGGPGVDFLPIGIYGPTKPGVYRVFAEFNPDNHLIVADFTVKVGP